MTQLNTETKTMQFPYKLSMQTHFITIKNNTQYNKDVNIKYSNVIALKCQEISTQAHHKDERFAACEKKDSVGAL